MLGYILILIVVDYAKNYSSNTFSGIVGSVTKVDDIDIEYHMRIGDNRNRDCRKTKSINNIDISYHKITAKTKEDTWAKLRV